MINIFELELLISLTLVAGLTFNPYKPSVLFVGHEQTVQNQISDQVFHCLLTEMSFKICIKMKNTNQQP